MAKPEHDHLWALAHAERAALATTFRAQRRAVAAPHLVREMGR